ncbi:MAG: hypothetical protein DIZ80_13675 [endosymbiont of Galathealinum brachiosum]|uniref:Transcriptional antiterminator, Rof n=1 Tax=endosymbiont of Galathealinum brachiosum TaxID=2200906 RepID=A0A370D8C9_9GAMM|nr:MAG: hypothetical protein DIZ80_13675 [endosymbiont of Galathealinum brachiosum]
MPDKPYIPIACADYDIYEIAIMHNKRLRVKWMTEQGMIQSESLIPQKLQIINKAEYLIVDSKITDKIRLDKIQQAAIIEK